MSPCNIDEFKTTSDKLKEKLGLENSPVAVKLFLKEDEAKETLTKIDGKFRHCEMVYKASQGESFYATSEEEACKTGAAALGFNELPPRVATGEHYFAGKLFASRGSAKHAVDQIPTICEDVVAMGYAPLEDAKFQPDVVIFICQPAKAMKIAQSVGRVLGKRFFADFAGVQSVCADAFARVYLDKEPNLTLGCHGSRSFGGITDDELIISLTGENLGCVVNSLDSL
ncbi:MAG: DUF169 domain-containing protein [Methanobacteriaceae archaeon]|nr:DUF169 domain-containing protein [Methanobacteriaceae archaeon]